MYARVDAMLGALALTLSPLLAQPSDPPEGVVIVVLDDVGPEEVAAAPTPTLDQLAASGRRYSVAWAGPSCSNARAQLVSGRFPFRPENRVGSNVREPGIFQLEPDPRFVPARVTDAGLSATHLGKWHLTPAHRLDHPRECGYSYAAGTEANLSWSGDWSYFQWVKVVDGVAGPRAGYVTSDTIDDAVHEVHLGTDLLVVNLHAPHAPVHCPPPELAPVSTCPGPDPATRAMLEAADTELARLATVALASDYTMFVLGDNSTTKHTGGKWTVYESGLRVPALAVGHGVEPGDSQQLLSILDLGPTALDLLGVSYEEDWFDGVSLADELGGAAPVPRYLYAEIFPSGAPYGLQHRRAIRNERWKLHTSVGYPPEEFYDLRQDGGETTNLLEGRLTVEQQAAYLDLREHLPE